MSNREPDAVELMLDALDDHRTSSNKRPCVRAYEHPLRARQELRQSAWPVRLWSSRTGMCSHKAFEGRKYGDAVHLYLA